MNTATNPGVRQQSGNAVRVQTLLTVQEAARALRIGRNKCYELIRQGLIPHVRIGRIIRIPRDGLEAWIARESGLPQPPTPVVSFMPQPH